MKKAYFLKALLITFSFYSFSQKDPCAGWKSEDNNPQTNKKVALLCKEAFEKNTKWVGPKGTYYRHILYAKWEVNTDALGVPTEKYQVVNIIFKDKKGNCKHAVMPIRRQHEGGGKYGAMYYEPETIAGGGELTAPKIDCECADKLTDWLGGSTNTSNNNQNSSGNKSGSSTTSNNNNNQETNSGSPNGPYERKHDNGTVAEKGNYVNGKKQGMWTEYNEDGTLKTEIEYKDNEKTGVYNLYENGKKVYEYKYVNGKQEGEQKNYYTRGLYNVKEIYMAKNDQRHGLCKTYDEKGSLHSEDNYQDGKLNGKNIRYYEDSKIKAEEQNYKNGKKDGAYLHYDKTGKMDRKGQFVNGNEEGRFEEYDGGKLRKVKNYKNGQMDGTQEWYNAGKLVSSEVWENGVKIK